MKPLLYHIIACCAAVLFFTACDKECDIPGGNVVGDGNSIILDLSSGSLPMSRAVNTAATGAEVKVNHIDVLIFDENGIKQHHERVGGSETGNGTIVLSAKRSGFTEKAKYEVHLIANSTADVSVFAADDFDKTKLRGLTQTDRNIHMTGYPGTGVDAPETFLMDGIAHLEGSTDTQVVLNDGDKSNDTKLKATLHRAAAKLVIKIKKGQFVEFNDGTSGAGYYLRNMPYTTTLVPSTDFEATLRTPRLNSGEYFKWTKEAEDGPYTLITVTAYAYAHSWDNASSLEKETRLIVNIPMWTILHNEHDQYVDESGNFVTDPVKVSHENSYYQIPVCEGTALERNTCYEVFLTLNVPGGTDPSEPIKLEPINYEVREWDEKTINIGGETDRPEYLTLNENEMEMHNMEDDHTTLQFSSSSEVTATITKVYYIDKFGQEQVLTAIPNTDNEWGVRGGTTQRPTWTNQCTLRITPDDGINGKIDVFGTVPENNAVRYIEFTVTNETGQTRSVTVAQYPLEYITNMQSWYSYRDDFKESDSQPTSYEYQGDRIVGVSYNERSGYTYNTTSSGFWRSKVATSHNSDGSSKIQYYRWSSGSSWGWSSDGNGHYLSTAENSGNARIYHVQITASSGDYTLGRPRLTADGYTDPGADNAELVSPSFMIASRLGFLNTSSNIDLSQNYGLTVVRDHCANYVEVYTDEKGNKHILDDWRLPTDAELKIIMKFQGTADEDADAIDYLLNAAYYWSARGRVSNSKSSTSGTSVRCIRDAYNDKKTGN